MGEGIGNFRGIDSVTGDLHGKTIRELSVETEDSTHPESEAKVVHTRAASDPWECLEDLIASGVPLPDQSLHDAGWEAIIEQITSERGVLESYSEAIVEQITSECAVQ